ncbi:MAG: NADH-quinone oxidoreductase subunit [Actinomycetota bacterium]|jgi:NADH-quinone oxidoreductase subunit L
MVHATWLIPALPLTGFLLLVLFGRRLGDPAAGWLATAMVGLSFLTTVGVFVDLLSRAEAARSVTVDLFAWIPSGGLSVNVAFLADPLSITMALFVTGVGALIHLYSVGYMHGDPQYPRFFVYLNLFAFSMLVLVLADNFLLSFLGWEGVGACSYLLISFWFTRETAASAGKKAFVTNRVGDFGFMVAVFLIFSVFGTLTYSGVLPHAHDLSRTTATAIALLLFLGAAGKSAQLPLYVWLPDAMEGPTPVSALIHAATMVTAGVYLMVRVAPILHEAPTAMTVIACVGGATALFAATIACAQNDIKKVLAYSTISQLGYMFLAVGSGAYVAAIFHMVTHAFFKALMFLGAGSVIHGLHDEQDMKRMGNLRKYLPITYGTFLIGWLAISGIPPFAGFWSKDEILLGAWNKSWILWAIGAFTALLTAYYMTRQVRLVFYGEDRWSEVEHPTPGDADPELSHPEPVADNHGAGRHGAGDHAQPHESPPTMWVPLVVLALLSLVGGVINLPFTHRTELLLRWLEPVLGDNIVEFTGSKLVLALVASALAALGILIGWTAWRRADRPALEPEALRRAWYVDPLYQAIIVRPGAALASFSAWVIDRKVVDGAVNGVAVLFRDSGSQLRRLQTGYVRNYALGVAAGTVGLLAWFLVRAR